VAGGSRPTGGGHGHAGPSSSSGGKGTKPASSAVGGRKIQTEL